MAIQSNNKFNKSKSTKPAPAPAPAARKDRVGNRLGQAVGARHCRGGGHGFLKRRLDSGLRFHGHRWAYYARFGLLSANNLVPMKQEFGAWRSSRIPRFFRCTMHWLGAYIFLTVLQFGST